VDDVGQQRRARERMRTATRDPSDRQPLAPQSRGDRPDVLRAVGDGPAGL
jgi:hypothetical protein